ncbi:MAG: DUF1998 domain-containing protein, partial [Lentisphaerota bacterium]
LHHADPCLCMAYVSDNQTDVSLHEEESQHCKSSRYLYDAQAGGLGYAEKIFERLEEAWQLCLRIIEECECSHGCPSCVPPLPPGVSDQVLEDFLVESDAAVTCTRSLLQALLTGKVVVPKITIVRRRLGPAVEPEPEDPAKLKLQARLSKASGILKKKRERQH